MIVKVCGITSLEDALFSLEHGANALGFNFWRRSPRFIPPRSARLIIDRLSATYDQLRCLTVGVLVGTAGWEEAPTDVLQFHGLKSPSEAPVSDRRYWFATSSEHLEPFHDAEVIIDGSWGTGRQADWARLETIETPYILSGGLTPDNVREAIGRLHPAGVDVCSGVERAPGRKDPEKVRRFLKEVQRALE